MRRFQIGSLIALAIVAVIVYSLSMPAVAQQPFGKVSVEHGSALTVVYSLTLNLKDEVRDVEYLDNDGTWFVVEFKGRRIFIPTKNILRIDVHER